MSKRTKIILGLFVSFCTFAGYLFLYEPNYSGSITQSSDQSLVFAHRGYGNHAPDNSLEGARIAIQSGLDGVDVDAQFSKDKEIIIFHDVSLERFTTGEGRVDAKDVSELRNYDLGIKYGNGFENVFIHTFEDFVKEVTPTNLLMVELKVSTPKDTGIEKRVAEILEQYNAYDRVYISSFNPVVLYRLKDIDERIRTVFIFMDSGWDPKRVAETKEEDRVALPWYLQNEYMRRAIRKIIKPDAVSINKGVAQDTITTLMRKGYPVFIWSVNTEEEISEALMEKPYGIISDEPSRAKEIKDQSF